LAPPKQKKLGDARRRAAAAAGAADQPVRVRIISVYAVRNGHIVEDNTYYDRKIP
jgi:ketosteroid isomerase-like protein